MSLREIYSSGDWNTICDVCGRKYKNTDLRKRWDNLMVCSQDYEERQPQDFVRARADQIAVPWSRPEGADTFVPINYTTSIGETNNLSEIVSKYVTKIVPNKTIYVPDLATDEGLGLSFLGKYTLAGTGAVVGFTHTLLLSESVNVILSKNIIIAETISVSEATTRAINKNISENITPTEIVSRRITKAVSETTTLSEVLSKSVVKTATDTLASSESQAKGVIKGISEATTLSEITTKSVARSLSDTVAISETSSKVVNKIAADSLTTTEAFIANLLINKSLGSQFLGKTTLG